MVCETLGSSLSKLASPCQPELQGIDVDLLEDLCPSSHIEDIQQDDEMPCWDEPPQVEALRPCHKECSGRQDSKASKNSAIQAILDDWARSDSKQTRKSYLSCNYPDPALESIANFPPNRIMHDQAAKHVNEFMKVVADAPRRLCKEIGMRRQIEFGEMPGKAQGCLRR
mmetsp:Transcript_39292/g.73323  ORF Transcript_39292/g.73323 Transcript_39292/m.73323 type:complete len:169 (+) Transcript_39292:73-579(+)